MTPSWSNSVPVNAVENVAEVLAEEIEPMTCTAVAPDVARRRREDQAVILPQGAAEGLSEIMRASQVPLRAVPAGTADPLSGIMVNYL